MVAKCRLLRRRGRAAGFTLIEVAITIVIVGTAILATMQLITVCTRQSTLARQITIGTMLANNIHEALSSTRITFASPYPPVAFGREGKETSGGIASYNDIDDFDGVKISPPVDASLVPLPEHARFTQEISVEPVKATKLTETLPKNAAGPFEAKRITVTILAPGQSGALEPVHQMSWVRTKD